MAVTIVVLQTATGLWFQSQQCVRREDRPPPFFQTVSNNGCNGSGRIFITETMASTCGTPTEHPLTGPAHGLAQASIELHREPRSGCKARIEKKQNAMAGLLFLRFAWRPRARLRGCLKNGRGRVFAPQPVWPGARREHTQAGL